MIQISKEEKEYISNMFPDVHIRRTMAQKSARHRYYMEETPRAVHALDSYNRSKAVRRAGTAQA